LDPEDIKILSLGAIWNFGKGTGPSWADIRLRGTNGPSIRPRCIGTLGARTQCKSIKQKLAKLTQKVKQSFLRSINILI